MQSYIAIFFVSLFAITLELFLTRILNLKTWNHVVYIIIPFAILGYGIGANLYLIFSQKIDKVKKNILSGACLLGLAISCFLSTIALVYIPVKLKYIVTIFVKLESIIMLLTSYALVMLPFIVIGFFVVYLFSTYPKRSHKLYFVDLVGAGIGAYLFFPLIDHFEVIRSLFALSLVSFALSLIYFYPNQKRMVGAIGLVFLIICFNNFQEPKTYTADLSKGWENIPGYFEKHQYQTLTERWHPLGRTDIYRIINPTVRQHLTQKGSGTFQVNLDPLPEFSYFSTNFLAGTPAYKFSQKGLSESKSKLKLFSQSMEVPYTVLDKPRVVVIGAGGGRDIFMAQSHQAQKIVGAEINPVTYSEMAKGGLLYDYSNRIYTQKNVTVQNVDGRHLVKTLQPSAYDLIILNGVDTFTGLSSGAYAYAESYLYTKNAVMDYLKILNDTGIINFNRWLFPAPPRETLRLQAISMAALEELGYERPWEHIIIGGYQTWSITLVKKTPFTPQERSQISKYFKSHGTILLYPTLGIDLTNNAGKMITAFDVYAHKFRNGQLKEFERSYPYDISVITDDNPFFYKYYRLKNFNPFKALAHHHTGTIIFLTQLLVLIEALFFIILFIYLPLYIFKRRQIRHLPNSALKPFITYFSCLGIGFMFIEIPLMQKFTLILGSPIYSISVTLAVLLISAGLGSFLVPYFERLCKTKNNMIITASLILTVLFFCLQILGSRFIDLSISQPFSVRVLIVSLMLLPLGLGLGVYFPSGLLMISKNYPGAIPWAWGLNSCFSVLGSIISIILAQFLGFNAIISLGCVIYLLAALSFRKLSKHI